MSAALFSAVELLSALFEEERLLLNKFFDSIELSGAERLLNMFLSCQGHLFFTGVGKSGFIAQKLAATMASLGAAAFYLSPLDALHGDLGNVARGDVVLFLSKSGESDELLTLLPYLREKEAIQVAIVHEAKSRLAKGCDFSVALPLEKELCPFDLAPTTSTEMQLVFGNVLAIAYMKAKEINAHDFAKNHPAGRIGRRMNLKVQDLMISGSALPICFPENLLTDCIVILSDKRCGCLLVVNRENRLLGIFTDGDLRRALQAKKEAVFQEPMHRLMVPMPRSVGPEVSAWKAMQVMEELPDSAITVLPVIDSGAKLLGLIKMHDILQKGL